ncbi:hypothetical protein BKH46_04420 [Helicobacter sp. 12S02634-8]|uniref:nicotinate (nicotinamide) nucleotide adenylyltransferase n=1 Tax=Helicobacter sp. 12S02634-8 TaxID=1476199 RepID=UPI000BA5B2FE|nr:nicotinate (nicotinamide) nucleotide adenylyltransferase [Helicobacter sp. 12S02634-8]PAF47333.1 hypothetical protein BKH46_04420 [Helicobacter sp. 12S02634-8]
MNIAIYGGSFDPPHIAHIQIIQTVLLKVPIDKLIVIVAYQNPFKNPCLFQAQERYAWMCELCSHLPKVIVSDMEITQKKPIPSIQSVLEIQKKFAPKKIYFIIGEDNIPHLHKWHQYQKLQNLVEFIIIEREGYQEQSPKDQQTLSLPNLTYKISSSEIRKSLYAKKLPENLPEKIRSQVIYAYHTQPSTHLRRSPLTPTQTPKINQRIQHIIDLLDAKKAQDIEVFDLKDKDYIVDYVIITTAMAGKHSYSLLDMLKTELKAEGEVFYSTDEESEDWLIADLGDVMIHIFTQNHRRKFNLEEFLSQLLAQNPSQAKASHPL